VPATRPNRLDNPLRKLRLILGNGERPAGQVEFANTIGMSVATLRAIEAGRRLFSKDCQDQIFKNLFARWKPKKQRWYLGDTDIPYQKEHVSYPERFDPHDPFVDDYTIHRLIERILTMFKNCPTRMHRRGLLVYLFRDLKETSERLRLKADLKPTEPRWMQTRNPKVWGKSLTKEIVFWPVFYSRGPISPHQEPDGIFDFRSWRSFRPADYPEGKIPVEQDGLAQERTTDNGPAQAKPGILSAPIAHPNVEEVKLAPKEGASTRP
jgi:hypothetical protein